MKTKEIQGIESKNFSCKFTHKVVLDFIESGGFGKFQAVAKEYNWINGIGDTIQEAEKKFESNFDDLYNQYVLGKEEDLPNDAIKYRIALKKLVAEYSKKV